MIKPVAASHSGLPGGYRNNNGNFNNMGNNANFWTSPDANTYDTWYWFMHYNTSGITRGYYEKHFGFSIRCVRDD